MENKLVDNNCNDKTRDPWIDNIRAVLMILVVTGHFLVVMTGRSEEMFWLRKFIYLFHMPAFLIVSGMLLKRKINKRRYADGIKRYLAPYMICNFAMFFLFQFIGADQSGVVSQSAGLDYVPFLPYYSFWYILAVFLYLMITPTLLGVGKMSQSFKYRPALVFALAVLCAVGIGFSKHYIKFMYLSPAIGFYPFFLFGYFLDVNKLKKILKHKLVVLLCSVLWIGVIVLSWRYRALIDLQTFTMVRLAPASMAEQSILIKGGYRILVLAIGGFLSLLLFAIVPQKEIAFSKIGQYSVYPYCIHTLTLPFLFYTVNQELFAYFNSTMGCILFLLVCVVFAWVTTLQPVRMIFRPLIEPRVDWSFLFSKEEE